MGDGPCLDRHPVAWFPEQTRKAVWLNWGRFLPVDMSLTENEGSLLGVIVRLEPLSSYQLIKIFEESPVAKFNNSKGAVYPQVRRLKARGFLEAASAKDEKKPSELVKTTELGREALRLWVQDISHDHTFLPDPIRTRMMLLDLLSRDEQIAWIVDMRRLLEEKKREVQEFASKTELPFGDVVHASAIAGLDVRMEYIDRLLVKIVRPGGPN